MDGIFSDSSSIGGLVEEEKDCGDKMDDVGGDNGVDEDGGGDDDDADG